MVGTEILPFPLCCMFDAFKIKFETKATLQKENLPQLLFMWFQSNFGTISWNNFLS